MSMQRPGIARPLATLPLPGDVAVLLARLGHEHALPSEDLEAIPLHLAPHVTEVGRLALYAASQRTQSPGRWVGTRSNRKHLGLGARALQVPSDSLSNSAWYLVQR
jgi:hypothetical protein